MAGKTKDQDLLSIPVRFSFLFKAVVYGHLSVFVILPLTINETSKRLSQLLMQDNSGGDNSLQLPLPPWILVLVNTYFRVC